MSERSKKKNKAEDSDASPSLDPNAFLEAERQRCSRREMSIYGVSEALLYAFYHTIPQCARSNDHVLVIGETGTGKELVVKQIRREAGEEEGFRAVNCAQFSREIIASELFGHKKGSFTGANEDRPGLIETLDGGALFLDELGALPQDLQAQLLRVIEEREFRRVGDTEVRRLQKGIRVFAATNDPESLRRDLKWRFQVSIYLPPLRERIGDVFLILQGMLDEAMEEKRVETGAEWWISPDTFVRMLYSRWEGNVRELRNAVDWSIDKWRPREERGWMIPFWYNPDRDAPEMLTDFQALSEIWSSLVESALKSKLWEYCCIDDDRIKAMGGCFQVPLAVQRWSREGALFDKCEIGDPERELLSCAEAVQLLCSVVEQCPSTGDMLGGYGYANEWPIHYLSYSLLDKHKQQILSLPQSVLNKYKVNGSRKEVITRTTPDLTDYTEEELLREYYTQLARAHPTQKSMAEAAGISPQSMGRRKQHYLTAGSNKNRKRNP